MCSLEGKVATNLPLCVTAKYIQSTHIAKYWGEQREVDVKEPTTLRFWKRSDLWFYSMILSYLECNWRNIAAFSDFHTWGRIKLTIYIKLQCTHELECFKIHCYAISGTTAVPPNAAATSEIHAYAVSNAVSQSPVKNDKLLRRQDDCFHGSEIYNLERSLCQHQNTILITFSGNIW